MDAKQVFRKLITNEFVHGFDYKRQFTFQTVYHRTAYSYCVCVCGFEHEYLDYISDSGIINEKVYTKILQCILTGNCPHTDKVSDDYVRETSISAFNIAAAVGTTEVFMRALGPVDNISEGLYNLSLNEIALIKNPAMVSYSKELELRENRLVILDPKRLNEENINKDTVRVMASTVFDYCARKGGISPKILCNMADTSVKYFVSALQVAFKYDIIELQEMLKRKWRRMTDAAAVLEEYCTLAIVYDKSELLYFLLHQAEIFERRKTLKCNIHMASNLNKACEALQRHDCKQVLLIKQNFLSANKYDLPGPSTQMSLEDRGKITFNRVQVLIHLLFRYNLGKEILPMLSTIPEVSNLLNESQGEYGTILHAYNCSPFGPDPALLKVILDMGVDINRTDSNGMAPLIQLLAMKEIWSTTLFRGSEELYVFENPNMQAHRSALVRSLRIDKICHTKWFGMFETCAKSNDFLMDAQEHGMQGYDGDDMALNFMVPFLFECGFPIMEDFLDIFEDIQDSLNPVEQVYIHQCLEIPRSLLLQCRDTLRKHYRGRQIHQFVEMAKIPESVKDFILLKPLLKYVPGHLLQ